VDEGQGARGSPDADSFEVFPTGATVVRALDARPDDVVVGETLRRTGRAVRDGYDHAREFRARPGHRPGPTVGQPGAREGGDADIVRPVLIDPLKACRLAVSGELFASPIDHLRIEGHVGAAEYLVWDARITTDHGRGVPATLHLLASPSMVVTVLELIPRRRLRRTRGRFVRDGVAAIEELARRLQQSAA